MPLLLQLALLVAAGAIATLPLTAAGIIAAAAAYYGYTSIVTALVEAGADMNANTKARGMGRMGRGTPFILTVPWTHLLCL
jgi:hypothetical protein